VREIVAGTRGVELAHAPIDARRRVLGRMRRAQLPRRVDLLDGRVVRAFRPAPELRSARKLVELVLRGPFRQGHRALREPPQSVAGEVGPVREPEPPAGENAQSHTFARRLLQLLDVSFADLDRRLARALRVRLGIACARLLGQPDELRADVDQGFLVLARFPARDLRFQAQAPVPPTVTPSMRTVGNPTPTGTL